MHMRTIDTSQLQPRMIALSDGTIDVPSLFSFSIKSIQQALPSVELGKRLLPFIGDNLLTCLEQMKAGTNDAAPLCLKGITNDVLDYAITMDASIDTTSNKWQACTHDISIVIDNIVLQYSGYVASEKLNGSAFSEIPKVKKGILDAAIADTVKRGDTHVERLEIAGTSAVVTEGKCIERFVRGKAVTTHPWCPKVVRYYVIPDAPSNRRKIYIIDVNGSEHECTAEEIENGTAWSHFTNATGTHGAQNKALLANVVDTLATETCTPISGYVTVGWNTTLDGKHVYVLEDGRGLDGTAYYVLNTKKETMARGKEHMSILPLEPIALEDVEALWAWIYDASPLGHQQISIAAQFRSYLHNILPAYTTFFLYSANDGREASRLGKTTIQLASCNLSFRTHYKDTPHASFDGTQGSIEKIIAHMQSSNCVIDDLNIAPTSTEKDIKDKASILSMIVRTTANNTEARSRLKRNLEKAESSMFELLPSVNGEILPPILASLERRFISVEIAIGNLLIPMYEQSWEDDMSIRLLKLGHMALRTIEAMRNEDAKSLRYEIDCYEKDMGKKLKSDVIERLGAPLTQLCDGMPNVYACLLSSIWALGRYAFTDEIGQAWSTRLYPFVLDALTKQINRMDGKTKAINNVQIILDAIRSVLHMKQAHLKGYDGKLLTSTSSVPVTTEWLGYSLAKAIKSAYMAHGTLIGYVLKGNEYIAFITKALYPVIQKQLKEQGLDIDKTEMLKILADNKLILTDMPNYEKQVRINKIKNRYMVMAFNTLFSTDEDGEVFNEDVEDETGKAPISIDEAPSKRNEALAELSVEDAEMIVAD